MGVYIYSVRTKSVNVEGIDAPVYPLRYLLKPFRFDDRDAARLTGAATATWGRRDERPRYVFVNHTDTDKPYDGASVYEWDGRAWDYDEPSFEGAGRHVGFLRKVGNKWTVSPIMFNIDIGLDTGPDSRHVERSEMAFTRLDAERIRAGAAIQGHDVWVHTYEADPDPEVDRLVREHSAFNDFRDLLNAKGSYRPSLDVREPERAALADAYDIAMELRGDDRRAYRYGI